MIATNFCGFLWSENFRLCRLFFVWFVLFYEYLHGVVAWHGYLCVFDISSELYLDFRGRNEYHFCIAARIAVAHRHSLHLICSAHPLELN